MENLKVIIGFPEITEIRIGSALRIAISSYILYNNKYDNIVPFKKLAYLLKNLKNVYTFKTIKNYSEYVIKFYLGEDYDIPFNKGKQLDMINKSYGIKIVPLDALIYFNNVLLSEIIKIALIDLSEEESESKIITLSSKEYMKFYNDIDDESDKVIAFLNDITYYLEYNQIIHVSEFIVTKKEKDILLPINLSFVNEL